MSILTITPQELDAHMRKGAPVEMIDVRTPAEFRAIHAEPARSVPLERLDPLAVMQSRVGGKDDPLYVICQSGLRAEQACGRFQSAGYSNVVNVAGGTNDWERAGLAVVRGKKAVSLERQVRIAAGSLVVLFTGLGAFVHPAFLGLSAFIGAGLVFAGITDTCGMAMMLAKMPWNQVKPGISVDA